MKAKEIRGQAPGGKRKKLADVLPLDTPIVFQFFPIYACNFKCHYCLLSTDADKRPFISDKVSMDLGLYKKCLDDITSFSSKVKVLRFVGMGEPLLHKDIAEMVACAVSRDVAHTVEILTNASLLGPEVSDSLIKAGLSRLVVSLQGATQQGCRQMSGESADLKKIIDNLRYFFKHKDKTHVYIKIVDLALENKNDQQRFYEIFGDICDTIGIEYTVPIYPCVDYDSVLEGKRAGLTQFGLPVCEVKVCPQPFFTMQINPDGKVVPCYSAAYPDILGDCNNESVCEIWKGKKFQAFRRSMLEGRKQLSRVCAECKIITHRFFPEDNLDNDAERLKKFYEL